jgi:broad specificity phosphatase PhoE
VSEVVRLTLVSHAMTDAMAAGRFPYDEPLNALGERQIDGAVDQRAAEVAVSAPERRACHTAELLGLRPGVEPRLADLDVGRWRGHELAAVQPEELATWLSRPDSNPHGGESVVALITRVRDWMDDVSRKPARLTAVTHPAVIRAAILIALESPPKSFWRIDIAPASRTVLHFGGRWTLRWGQR